MKSSVNVTIGSAGNVNLGSQIGTINAALNVLSAKSQEQAEIVAAIKELSEAVMRSSLIREEQQEEALQVIAAIARQAEVKPEARSTGMLKALIAGFPTAIGLAADVTTLWEKYVPVIRSFFGV